MKQTFLELENGPIFTCDMSFERYLCVENRTVFFFENIENDHCKANAIKNRKNTKR